VKTPFLAGGQHRDEIVAGVDQSLVDEGET
jgi:hypothetical protein